MRNHSTRRFLITAVAAVAVSGAALLPGVASADGGHKPQNPAVGAPTLTGTPLTNPAPQIWLGSNDALGYACTQNATKATKLGRQQPRSSIGMEAVTLTCE
jgi:hypothetical protein